jgi:UDP-N-acetylmuramoylalanine--D-glutamate ligase
MITSPAFRGRRYAVLGLARSGLATVRALLASGAEVLAWDSSEAARDALERDDHQGGGDRLSVRDFVAFDNFHGLDAVVVSPGVPLNQHPVADKGRAAGVDIIGDIELFARARASLPQHRIVGITGTNGKSTTTALIHHILKTAGIPTEMGGNIGLPILAQEPLQAGGVYVLELSSYQIDLTRTLSCDVAILLNITPDHLDRYESFQHYAWAKAALFDQQQLDQVAVIAVDDPQAQRIADDFRQYGIGQRLIRVSAHDVANQSAWPTLQGPHNAENAAAAIVACRELGLGEEVIEHGLRTYPGLPHRMQRIADRNGVLFVNDSKATNAESTAPALAAFKYIHWIVGGVAKTHSLGPCEDQLGHVRAAYTIGRDGPIFAQLLKGRVPVTECEYLVTAVNEAAEAAVAGEVVLLSPACASFDQFRDFEDRGDAFRAAVGALE